MNTRTSTGNARGRVKVKKISLLLVLLDAVLAAVLGIGILIGNKSETGIRDAAARYVGETPAMTEEERQELYAIAVGTALREVTLRSEVTAENGRLPIRLSNGEGNGCAVSMRLLEPATGTVWCETGLLEPGWHLDYVTVNHTPEKGTHYLLAQLSFYVQPGDIHIGSAARQVLARVE